MRQWLDARPCSAADASRWRNLLQAVNLSAKLQGLSSKAFRVRPAHGPGSYARAGDAALIPLFQGLRRLLRSGFQPTDPLGLQPQGGSTAAAASGE